MFCCLFLSPRISVDFFLCTIDESIKGAASLRRYGITFDGNIDVQYRLIVEVPFLGYISPVEVASTSSIGFVVLFYHKGYQLPFASQSEKIRLRTLDNQISVGYQIRAGWGFLV